MLDLGPCFRNVIVNDLVLDVEGQKMSKSRGNVVDPWVAIESFGVDAIRWYFLTASQPWVPKRYDPAALGEAARRAFDTLANTYRFFSLYANLENWAPSPQDPAPAQRGIMDRWILTRLAQLIQTVRTEFDGYELTRGARAIGDFIVDDLSNWYVRRSRERFWGSSDAADTRAAFATLHEVLEQVARLLAPLTPFHSDWLHRALVPGKSVHLASFPTSTDTIDRPLEEGMRVVRVLARLGRAARDRVKIRVRQPLGTLQAVVSDPTRLTAELLDVLRDELNIKRVQFLQGATDLVSLRAQPNFRQLGKRFAGRTQQAAQQIRALDAESLRRYRSGEAVSLAVDGASYALEPGDLDVIEEAAGELVVESDEGCTIALDPAVDETLQREGLARELVNRIQRLRKDAGFEVSDRIRLGIFGDAAVLDAVTHHGDYIARETLAVDIVTGAAPDEEWSQVVQDVDLDDKRARVGVRRT